MKYLRNCYICPYITYNTEQQLINLIGPSSSGIHIGLLGI